MKCGEILFRGICMSVAAIMAITFSGCEKVDDFNENDTSTGSATNENSSSSSGQSGTKRKVNIIARSASSDALSYPITIFATDSTGSIVSQKTVSSSDDASSLQLTEGKYSIIAVAGGEETGRQGDKANVAFTSWDSGFSTTPLQMGSADISVESSSATVNIIMSYMVANMNISISGVPEDVSSAKLTLSPIHQSLSLTGNYSGSTVVTLPLSKVNGNINGIWETGTTYIFPGNGSKTVMTLTLSSPSGDTSYGITYNGALKAATPYSFTGSYVGTELANITASMTSGSWNTTINGIFSFGPGGDSVLDIDGGKTSDATEYSVTEVPSQGSIWNGHVVALVDTISATEYDVLLISKAEQKNVPSANSANDPTLATSYAEKYVEKELSGWSIPTSSQALMLRSAWVESYQFDNLNKVITNNGGTKLSVKDSSGNSLRYLCDEAKNTFSFSSTAKTVLQAGGTVKYALRLVKAVRLKK